MAVVIVEMFTRTEDSRGRGGTVANAHSGGAAKLTTGLASVATTLAADLGEAALVMNRGPENVWLMFGITPTAAVGQGHYLANGATRTFEGLQPGYKVAAINDA